MFINPTFSPYSSHSTPPPQPPPPPNPQDSYCQMRTMTSCSWRVQGPPHSGKYDPRSLLDPVSSPSHPGCLPPGHTRDDCDIDGNHCNWYMVLPSPFPNQQEIIFGKLLVYVTCSRLTETPTSLRIPYILLQVMIDCWGRLHLNCLAFLSYHICMCVFAYICTYFNIGKTSNTLLRHHSAQELQLHLVSPWQGFCFIFLIILFYWSPWQPRWKCENFNQNQSCVKMKPISSL